MAIPLLRGVTYAGSGPGPKPQGPGVPVPGPGGSEYGGEWEAPMTTGGPVVSGIQEYLRKLQGQGLPPTPQNVNRIREATSNGVTLPRPPIPPQPGPDRTVEGYQPNMGEPDTSSRPPTPAPQMQMPPNEGGTPRPPDGSGDPVTQGSPRGPSPQAVGLPEPGGPPQAFPALGRDILNLRPLLQLLTTPNASLNQFMRVPDAEYAGNSPIGASGKVMDVPMEGTALEGPPKRPQLAGPQPRPATPAAPLAIAGPRAQQALPAPAPSGPGFSPEYAPGGARQLSGPGFSPEYNINSPAKAAIDKAVPADEPVAPRAKRKSKARR